MVGSDSINTSTKSTKNATDTSQAKKAENKAAIDSSVNSLTESKSKKVRVKVNSEGKNPFLVIQNYYRTAKYFH